MKKINCITREKIEIDFYYIYETLFENGRNKHYFKVYSDNIEEEDFAEFEFIEIDKVTLKPIMMEHHYIEKYVAKGIPERIIEVVQNITNKNVISSSNKRKILDTEYRTESSEKVWERLVQQNKAEYKNENDIYRYISK